MGGGDGFHACHWPLTSTRSKCMIVPPLVPHGMLVTLSVCTVTWTAAYVVTTGSIVWYPGSLTRLSKAPPRQSARGQPAQKDNQHERSSKCGTSVNTQEFPKRVNEKRGGQRLTDPNVALWDSMDSREWKSKSSEASKERQCHWVHWHGVGGV